MSQVQHELNRYILTNFLLIFEKQSRNLQNQMMMPRRNTEPLGSGDGSNLNLGLRENSMVADRRSTISIYILCRVLIEVIGQTTLECVTEDMADKLEDIIFNQLRSADPDTLASSPLRMANWTLFGQLLGVMSSIDFERVTDRFFADLEKIANTMTKDTEAKVELIVKGMSYIKLKVHILRLYLIPPLHLLVLAKTNCNHIREELQLTCFATVTVFPRKCPTGIRGFHGIHGQFLRQIPRIPRETCVLRDLFKTSPSHRLNR